MQLVIFIIFEFLAPISFVVNPKEDLEFDRGKYFSNAKHQLSLLESSNKTCVFVVKTTTRCDWMWKFQSSSSVATDNTDNTLVFALLPAHVA